MGVTLTEMSTSATSPMYIGLVVCERSVTRPDVKTVKEPGGDNGIGVGGAGVGIGVGGIPGDHGTPVVGCGVGG